MKYRWNIAKLKSSTDEYGLHYAEIFKDTCTPESRATFLKQLRLSFPESEYNISVSRVLEIHESIDLNDEPVTIG